MDIYYDDDLNELAHALRKNNNVITLKDKELHAIALRALTPLAKLLVKADGCDKEFDTLSQVEIRNDEVHLVVTVDKCSGLKLDIYYLNIPLAFAKNGNSELISNVCTYLLQRAA